jgi:hypothetical protein
MELEGTNQVYPALGHHSEACILEMLTLKLPFMKATSTLTPRVVSMIGAAILFQVVINTRSQ